MVTKREIDEIKFRYANEHGFTDWGQLIEISSNENSRKLMLHLDAVMYLIANYNR